MICDWAADIYLNGVIGWLSAAISAVPDGSDTDSEDWSDSLSACQKFLNDIGQGTYYSFAVSGNTAMDFPVLAFSSSLRLSRGSIAPISLRLRNKQLFRSESW
jgi:hypothetical protein